MDDYDRGLHPLGVGITILSLVAIGILFFLVASLFNGVVAFGISVLALGYFVAQGIREISAKPPHKGVITLFGKRTNTLAQEGLGFFPFYPWGIGFVEIKVEKINHDRAEQRLRTTDRAEIVLKNVGITFTPGLVYYRTIDGRKVAQEEDSNGKNNAEYLNQYINSGDETGVIKIIEDVIAENLREWAIGEESGDTWFDTIAAREGAIKTLINRIVGMSDFIDLSETPETEADEIREETRNGTGNIPIFDLGITLHRVNLGEMNPEGKLAEAAEKEAIEERQRDAEKVELEHVQERAKRLSGEMKISIEDAIEIVQTERGKVEKKINEIKVREETKRAAASILRSIIKP